MSVNKERNLKYHVLNGFTPIFAKINETHKAQETTESSQYERYTDQCLYARVSLSLVSLHHLSLCSSQLRPGQGAPPPTRHAACSEHQTAMYTMSWEVSYEHKRVGHEWVAESVICHLYHSVNQREQLKILYIYLKTYLHITFYKYLKNLHNSITILKWRTKITI